MKGARFRLSFLAAVAALLCASVLAPAQAQADTASYRQAVSDAYNLVSKAAAGDVAGALQAAAVLQQGTGTTQPEILADLSARPPAFTDATARLRALLDMLDGPASTSDPHQAKTKLQRLQDQVPLEVGLARLSAPVGVDMSQFDPDMPLEELDTEASKGMMAALVGQGGAGLTLRQLGQKIGVSAGLNQAVGTPEQIADHLERHWRESGAAGFILSPTFTPSGIHDFVEHVIPILQKRGIAKTEYPGTTFRETLSA